MMKASTKTPKLPRTFLIQVEGPNARGYIRYRSYLLDNKITYKVTTVGNKLDASRYLTLESTKKRAAELKERLKLETVKVIDDTTKKVYVIH